MLAPAPTPVKVVLQLLLIFVEFHLNNVWKKYHNFVSDFGIFVAPIPEQLTTNFTQNGLT